MSTTKMKCYCCKTKDDVRPYGANASWICFDCMMATPERQLEAQKQLEARFQILGDIPVVLGSKYGPLPLAGSLSNNNDTEK